MKKLFTSLLLVLTIAGVFAPVTLSITQKGARVETTQARAQVVEQQQTDVKPNDSLLQKQLGSCVSITNGTLDGCLKNLLYNIPYSLGGFAMSISAQFMDVTAAYTLSSRLYHSSSFPFVDQGWRITRDISNIFFIIILMFIALSLVLGIEIGHVNPRKIIASLVFVAILINFSMFITEIVIDASNTMALVFYNQIVVKKQSGGLADTTQTSTTISNNIDFEPKKISEALADSFKPNFLQSPLFWSNLGTDDSESGGRAPTYKVVAILIVAGVVYFVAAWAFFVAALSFIGRLITLWIAIIFAPFAFMSYIIPSTRGLSGFGWKEWWSTLISSAFAAPIFFFFLLLISLLSQAGISRVENFSPNDTSDMMLITVIIAMLFMAILLTRATKYVKKAAGEIGEKVTNIGIGAAKLAGGAAIGLAAGGLALGGRSLIGAAGNKLSKSNLLKSYASGTVTDSMRDKNPGKTDEEIRNSLGYQLKSRVFMGALRTGKKASSTSFDIRQTGIGNALSQASGMNFGSFGRLSAANSAGGFEGAALRKFQKIEKNKQLFTFNEESQHAIEDEVDNRKKNLEIAKEELAQRKADEGTKKELESLVKAEQAKPRNQQNQQNLANWQGQLTAITDKIANGKGQGELQKNVNDLQGGRKEERDAQGNVIYKPKFDASQEGKAYDVDANGDPIKDKDGKIVYFKADHTKVNKDDIASGRKNRDSLGLSQLETLVETNKKAIINSYLHQQMIKTGYAVHMTDGNFDALGNVKKLGHIDTKQMGPRQYGRAIAQGLGTAIVGTAIGTAIAGPLGLGIGQVVGSVMTASLLPAMRELVGNTRMPTDVFGRSSAAEAMHHASHEGAAHSFHNNYHAPNTGLAKALKDLLGAGSGGGGGGGHGGGGGGHGGGHDGGHGGGGHH